MADLINGFTALPNRDDPNFESAGEASRRLRERPKVPDSEKRSVEELRRDAAIADKLQSQLAQSSSVRSQRAAEQQQTERASSNSVAYQRGTGRQYGSSRSSVDDASSQRTTGRQVERGSSSHSATSRVTSGQQNDSASSSSGIRRGAAPLLDAGLWGMTASSATHQDSREQETSRRPQATFTFDYEQLDAIPQLDQRWAWLEISRSAIRHNVAEMRRYLNKHTRIMAVVKADGYGHGAVEVSKAALGSGAEQLAVSTVSEGVELRKAGITAPIVILEQPPATSLPVLLGYNITPSIYEPDYAIAYAEVADLHGVEAPYHLAVNTGMNRVGVPFSEAAEFLRAVDFHRALRLHGVFTHFATAESPETLDFQIQQNRFCDALDDIRAAGFNPGLVHAANSAALMRFPDVHFDMVRCGIAMYGIHPCEETRNYFELRPAMSIRARIIDVRKLPVSEGVSYGFAYRSPGNVKTCTLPLGYADGLRRVLSGKIDFIMDGRYFRQVGNICMDQCMFEVDLRNRANLGAFNPKVGDEVIVVGRQGAAEVTMEELAEKAGTIPYEMLTGFAQRMPRVYV